MSRRAAGWVLAIALLLVAGSLAWWWRTGRGGGRAGRPGAGGEEAGAAATERHSFDLYFPAAGGGLRAERRDLQVGESPKDRIRKVLEALLAGPAAAPAPASPASPPAAAATAATAAGLVRPLPPEVKLGSVELSADGTAFVDLRWPDHEDPPESGSTEEIQRVYSLVDSVALNVPEAKRVVLLWNGTQRITFAGHLDTSRPPLPDRPLLAP
ncbi:MAG: GerMN domain-containing protein, partial [Acidobacteria bacterium]|nr:GerMN domain-containing protein [Acidobacteriota bacterium]